MAEREILPSLRRLIEEKVSGLRTPEAMNPVALLKAIAWLESSGGGRSLATKYEASWAPGGASFERAPDDFKRLHWVYGDLIAQSFGSFQLLYATAWTLGHRGDPCELRNDRLAIDYVLRLLNGKVFDRYKDETVGDALDAYNSGTARDRWVPGEYVHKGKEAYEWFCSWAT